MIGETIGNFKIVSRLGRGGMGEVWLAEQQSIGTRVAIKVLNAAISEDNEHVQRFFNEARAVSRIQHAGIVKIFDVGHHTGHAYLIMEYLEGETLAQRIAQAKRLPLADLCEIGRQAASVLDATHSAGITHRDLKPDNIFIVPDRELARGYRVKILDFGIAKLTGTLAGISPRTTGTMGTPAYMAPEQWGDASKVDWRADLYSLGCVAFEMACGRPPFVVTNIAEACAKHLHDPPPHIRELTPDLPASLDALVDRLLAKSPADRADSMRDVERAFGSIGSGQPFALAETMAATGAPLLVSAVASTSTSRAAVTPLSSQPNQLHPTLAHATATPSIPAPARRRGLPFLATAILAVVALFVVFAIIKKGTRHRVVIANEPSGESSEHHRRDMPQPPVDAPTQVASAPVDAVAATPVLDAGQVASSLPKHTPVRPTAPKVGDTKADNKTIETPAKEGTIDADAVYEAGHHDVGIQNCYLTALAKDTTIGGKLTASVLIEETGRVSKVHATGISTPVERCIEGRLRAIQFPHPVGGPVLAYIPFSFLPPPPEDVAKGGTIRVHAVDSDELRVSPNAKDIKAEMTRLQPFLDECGHGTQSRIQLEIAPDGQVTNAHVLGAVAQLTIAGCVEKAVKANAAFPKSKGGIKTTISFRLSK